MRPIARLAIVALISLGASQPALAQEHDHHAGAGGLTIPQSLQEEHHELHVELEKAMKAGGRTGTAAKALEAALMPHFRREEEFALPPLGLLSRLSRGEVTPDMRAALAKTDKLKQELPRMLSEHKAIVARIDQLEAAATREKRTEVVRFARQLKAHALHEEEILYPTSLLIGEHLRLKLQP